MAIEPRVDLTPWETGKACEARLSASHTSRRLQETGQLILASAGLFEVEEEVLSTCQEPIENLGDRLMRARDTRVPLVELTLFPKDNNYDALSQLFSVNGRLVLSILGADGLEHIDDFWGNYLSFERVGLSIPGAHIIALDGDYGSEVTSVLSSGMYIDYDDSRGKGTWGKSRDPAFSTSYSYEDDSYSGLSGRLSMQASLDRFLEDFEVAVKRDGVVDVEAVDKTIVKAQLTTGGY